MPPNDFDFRAFAKLHPDFIIHLKKNVTAMVNLLSGHVIPLTYYSAGLPDAVDVKTLFGNTLHVTNAGGIDPFPCFYFCCFSNGQF